jgi:hypothetical protein
MSTRSRILWFGGATAGVLVGVLIAAATHGITGEAIAISVSSLGLIVLVSLAFFEVGLSEDREREADAERRKQAERPPHAPRRRVRPTRRGY